MGVEPLERGPRNAALQYGYRRWAPMAVPKLNLACGRDARPASDGWVNMDHFQLPGVDVVHDLLATPWPLKDGEFDYILASHVLEHIPHRIPGTSRDGIFVVLEEAWRVLRDGGLLEAIVPWYASHEWHEEPTHTRAVHPGMWGYLAPGNPMNYYTHARFALERTEIVHGPRPPLDRLTFAGKGLGYWACGVPALRRLAGRKAYARFLLRRLPRDGA